MQPDAILRKGYRYYIGDAYVLIGQIFGDTKKRFTDGTEIRTSKVIQLYGDNLVQTKSGTIYLVEWYRPESDGESPTPLGEDEGVDNKETVMTDLSKHNVGKRVFPIIDFLNVGIHKGGEGDNEIDQGAFAAAHRHVAGLLENGEITAVGGEASVKGYEGQKRRLEVLTVYELPD